MAGYSGTPLLKKLGIKPGHHIYVSGEPGNYWDWMSPLPDAAKVWTKPGKTPLDFVHLFVKEKKVFEKEMLRFRELISADGMIWISWPKKSSGVITDITEDIIRNFALKNRLVDIKVCAVDEIWSGLKLVIPVKLRNP